MAEGLPCYPLQPEHPCEPAGDAVDFLRAHARIPNEHAHRWVGHVRQQVDSVAAIRALAGSIFHVHAKDCRVDRINTMANGVLDGKSYTRELERSWIFRTVGYGSDAIFWKDLVSALRMTGYDHAISIEHEDTLMSGAEGLRKAVAFLKPLLIAEPAGAASAPASVGSGSSAGAVRR